jgi:hypothetical protein
MASTPTPLPLPPPRVGAPPRRGSNHARIRGILPDAEADEDGWGAEDLNKGMGKEEEMDG